MDAAPYLQQIARLFQELKLDAVMIGNAAAAIQGAPVTTVDIDFLFRRTPAKTIRFGDEALLVARPADIVRSKRAEGRPQDLAILVTREDTYAHAKTKERARPRSLNQQFEHMRMALITNWLALPPERRTNFLRRRIGIASTAL